MSKKYAWKGYMDYFKQEMLLSCRAQKLPLNKQLRIFLVARKVLRKHCATYLRQASIFTLLSPFVFYIILAFVVILDVKYSIVLPTIPVLATIGLIFLLLCYIDIKLIPIDYFPFMLEKFDSMIEDIDAFEKNELAGSK